MTNVHGFHAFFADWRARPLRTPEWRESKRANFPTEDQWRREYPETVEDVEWVCGPLLREQVDA